jgi:plasmid segregation protein ParM
LFADLSLNNTIIKEVGIIMTRLIGLDVGYGFVKVTDGRAGYSFPSVVGEGHNKPTFNVMSDQLSVVDDMKIGIDDELYFVGKSAIRHSKFAHRTSPIQGR